MTAPFIPPALQGLLLPNQQGSLQQTLLALSPREGPQATPEQLANAPVVRGQASPPRGGTIPFTEQEISEIPRAIQNVNAPAQEPALPGRAGLLTSVFGGQGSGLLGQEQQRQAGLDALVAAGGAVAQAAQPEFGQARRTLGSAITAGLTAGRESFRESIGTAEQARLIEREREAQTREDESRIEVGKVFADPSLTGQERVAKLEEGINTFLANGQFEDAARLERMRAVAGNFQPQFASIETADGITRLLDADGKTIREFTPEQIEALDPQARLTMQNQLLTGYRSDTVKDRERAEGFEGVAQTRDAMLRWAQAGGGGQPPLGDATAFVFNVIRTLDPGSVVRGSEIEALERSGAIDDVIKSRLKKLLTGVPDPTLVNEIYNGVINSVRGSIRNFDGVRGGRQRQSDEARLGVEFQDWWSSDARDRVGATGRFQNRNTPGLDPTLPSVQQGGAGEDASGIDVQDATAFGSGN